MRRTPGIAHHSQNTNQARQQNKNTFPPHTHKSPTYKQCTLSERIWWMRFSLMSICIVTTHRTCCSCCMLSCCCTATAGRSAFGFGLKPLYTSWVYGATEKTGVRCVEQDIISFDINQEIIMVLIRIIVYWVVIMGW